MVHYISHKEPTQIPLTTISDNNKILPELLHHLN